MDMGDLFDDLGRVLLYSVITLLGAILIVGALVYIYRRDKFKDLCKYVTGIALGFALAAIIAMSYIKGLDDAFAPEAKKLLFWPMMAELIIVMAGALAMLVCSLFGKKQFRIAAACTGAGALAGFIAILVEMSKYFGTIKADYPGANLAGMIVSAVVFMLLIAGIYFLGDKRELSDTRSIVYGAIAIALSFALSYVKFFEMPQGGSVTFASLLPLMIYCCMFGTRRGVIMCLIYGALQAVQDPWIIHPMQFLLDYPLAFGVIGISGIFVEKNVFKFKGGRIVAFLLGGIIAVILRYVCHVLSGVFAFADWADLDKYGTALAYSLAYNSFAFIDMIIALAAGTMLFASRSFVAQMDRSAGISESGGQDIVLNDDDDDIDLMLANSADSKNIAENEAEDGELADANSNDDANDDANDGSSEE